jgi:hypothetical protein
MAWRTMSSTMDKADAAYMVGLALERFHGLDRARPWYERAVDQNPNHPQAREALGLSPRGAQNPSADTPIQSEKTP